MAGRFGWTTAIVLAALAPVLADEPFSAAERERAIAHVVELSDGFRDATWSFEGIARRNTAGEAMTTARGRVLTAADQTAGAPPLRFTVWMLPNGTVNGGLAEGNVRGGLC